MIYLLLDSKKIKTLLLKKSLLGQYEVSYFEKEYQNELISQGTVVNTDLTASAIKETITNMSGANAKDKDVVLILPQDFFQYMRIEALVDLAPAALDAFVKEKARAAMTVNLDDYSSDYFVESGTRERHIHFYALSHETLAKLKEVCSLVDLNLGSVIPEPVTYFQLFNKTLRKEKKEIILFVDYEKKSLGGYLYDTYGLLDATKWTSPIPDENPNIEGILKEKASEFEKKAIKLNRLILSGLLSDKVRQDTFTKSVGVWTNPLKRIVPEFYQDYLKMFVAPPDKPLPLLTYDVCFGAFIFESEHKKFSLVKKGLSNISSGISLPGIKIGLPKKEILLFVIAFICSFFVFTLLSKLPFKTLNMNFKPKASPTPTQTPIPPSPTPVVNREKVKIKVLNGSGTRGKANDVKEVLKNKGYQEILTGNADSFDFTQSVLEVKPEASDAATLLQEDLKNNVVKFKVKTLPEKEAADIVLIIGTDFK